jgi:hypothetical protein
MLVTEERTKVAAQTYNKLHDSKSISDDELRLTIPILKSVVDFARSTKDMRLGLFVDRLENDLHTLQGFQKARKELR